tara:strand:- start:159 stop:353 length:195 start_codon:yes stop_codon:yes gene_type:complete
MEPNDCFEELIKNYDVNEKKIILKYLHSLDDKNRIVLQIAHDHLGSSFHIVRSNGYKEWLNTQS